MRLMGISKRKKMSEIRREGMRYEDREESVDKNGDKDDNEQRWRR